MMDKTLVSVGTLLAPDAQRDAVHFALAPMVAAQDLVPGQHVGVAGSVDPEPTMAGTSTSPIGIVDPFLTRDVKRGERFWLFLYPHTITSLRHQWTHPAFGAAAEPDDAVAQSRRWLEDLAARCDQTYHRLMCAASTWVDFGEYTYDNSEAYKGADFTDFWVHYERVTGRGVRAERKDAAAVLGSFFMCSC